MQAVFRIGILYVFTLQNYYKNKSARTHICLWKEVICLWSLSAVSKLF